MKQQKREKVDHIVGGDKMVSPTKEQTLRKKKINTIPFRLTLKQRIVISIRNFYRKYIVVPLGLCNHEGIVGRVGAKWYYCLDCQKRVFNEDWKEDREALKDT